MKICENCGNLNYKVQIIKNKQVCTSCGGIMSDAPQCKPTRKNQCGQPLQGETNILLDDVTRFEY